jgi:radical SAM protein with 4Fe4S-binding SPASM domain
MKSLTREQNLRLNLKEYNEGALLLNSLPSVIFVELTQNCNLHCKMCRASKGYDKGLDMSDDLFNRVAEKLFPTATLVDLRGWGESTMLRNFDERVLKTLELGPRIRLVTNALSLSPQTWEILMEAGSIVVVSMDATSPEIFAKLERGPINRILASIETGVEARDRNGSCGTILFNTVLNSENVCELPAIIRLAIRHKIPRVTVFPVITQRNNALHLCHVKELIPDALREASAIAKDHHVELRLGASLSEHVVVTDALMTRCTHPWSFCYVDFAGRIGYCDHLIGHPNLTLGSLEHDRFENIWNGRAFQDLRNRHVNVRNSKKAGLHILPHCAWCYSRRYVDFEDDIFGSESQNVVSSKEFDLLRGTPVTLNGNLDFLF